MEAWFIQTHTTGKRGGRHGEEFVLLAESFEQAAQNALGFAQPGSKVKLLGCFKIDEMPRRVSAY